LLNPKQIVVLKNSNPFFTHKHGIGSGDRVLRFPHQVEKLETLSAENSPEDAGKLLQFQTH
jgi:hypothetical protein